MRILVLGGDGYLGWPTAMYFSARGHDVAIIDNMIKRYWEAEVGVEPLFPIRSLKQRIAQWRALTGHSIVVTVADIGKVAKLRGPGVPDKAATANSHLCLPWRMMSQMMERPGTAESRWPTTPSIGQGRSLRRHRTPIRSVFRAQFLGPARDPEPVEEARLRPQNGRQQIARSAGLTSTSRLLPGPEWVAGGPASPHGVRRPEDSRRARP